ncbi:MAG: hypothetical protein VXX04_06010, partial [Actinomycetota bacterium]|nr:hypothetical protein [Actinomycetota bacterium]
PTADGRHWGPSLNIPQIRSIQEEAGTGATRDPIALRDPAFAARSAWTISEQGTKWTDWSVFNSGDYRQWLDEATVAAQSIGQTGVTVAGELAPGVPAAAQYTPAPTASLVAGMGVIGPNELLIEGDGVSGKVQVLRAELHRSIEEASTLTATVLDEDREFLNDRRLQQSSRTQIDGIYFSLSDVGKDGNLLTLTFVDSAAYAFIDDKGKTLTQVGSAATRGDFLRRLAAEHPEFEIDIETGATTAVELRTEPDESLWQAMGRIAREIGWRRLATANRVLIGSDEWLASRNPPITVRERTGGVDAINFDYRTGAEVDEAWFSCDASLWAAPPTQAVTVEDLGVASGD